LTIIGKTYDTYGYPENCGWIEGLLMLEAKEWTQKSISERLGELFPSGTHPTSIPSVNRALKILENYGLLAKTGSRKTGFRYRLVSSSNLISSMLLQLLVVNKDFISKMELLSTKNRKKDSELMRAISTQIKHAQIWNEVLEQVVESLRNEQGG
jgi:DNA-binding transcriptional regulator GbsR (MarR family)